MFRNACEHDAWNFPKRLALLFIQNYSCSGIVSCGPATEINFCPRISCSHAVDNELPWNILWTDEAYLHLQGHINTDICRISATKNPFVPIALHSANETVWGRLTASFIIVKSFFPRRLGLWVLLPVPSMLDTMRLFCAKCNTIISCMCR